jgi:hypothetical protein
MEWVPQGEIKFRTWKKDMPAPPREIPGLAFTIWVRPKYDTERRAGGAKFWLDFSQSGRPMTMGDLQLLRYPLSHDMELELSLCWHKLIKDWDQLTSINWFRQHAFRSRIDCGEDSVNARVGGQKNAFQRRPDSPRPNKQLDAVHPGQLEIQNGKLVAELRHQFQR